MTTRSSTPGVGGTLIDSDLQVAIRDAFGRDVAEGVIAFPMAGTVAAVAAKAAQAYYQDERRRSEAAMRLMRQENERLRALRNDLRAQLSGATRPGNIVRNPDLEPPGSDEGQGGSDG